jgi:hypothetical protein
MSLMAVSLKSNYLFLNLFFNFGCMKFMLKVINLIALLMTQSLLSLAEAVEEDAVPGYAVLPIFDKEINNWDEKQKKSESIAIINNNGAKKPLITRGGEIMRDAVTVRLFHFGSAGI